MNVTIEAVENGFRVLPLQTPKGTPVIVPTEKLAKAIGAEWEPIKRAPKLGEIPLTMYVNTALDLTAADPERAIAEALAYLPTDVLVMWHSDPSLIAEQKAKWRPHLDWAAGIGVQLEPNYRLQPAEIDANSEEAYRRAIEGFDALRMTALSMAAGLFGSAILGLEVVLGVISIEQALEAAWLEEDYQIARWKMTEEQAEKREAVKAEANMLAQFIQLQTA